MTPACQGEKKKKVRRPRETDTIVNSFRSKSKKKRKACTFFSSFCRNLQELAVGGPPANGGRDPLCKRDLRTRRSRGTPVAQEAAGAVRPETQPGPSCPSALVSPAQRSSAGPTRYKHPQRAVRPSVLLQSSPHLGDLRRARVGRFLSSRFPWGFRSFGPFFVAIDSDEGLRNYSKPPKAFSFFRFRSQRFFGPLHLLSNLVGTPNPTNQSWTTLTTLL